MQPLESQQSRVLMQLRDMILKGAFAPGERLAEIPLAERLEASRTPVRLALATLEHEGLIETSPNGGYQMRSFTPREVADAIRVRGVLEGMAARLIAEHGASRALLRELRACLEAGDAAVGKPTMEIDDYAAYAEANDRLHSLLIDGCENVMLKRLMGILNGQPFATASAMLPMQSEFDAGHEWMKQAQRHHHSLVQAIEKGQGGRAQALGEEHVEIALMNLDYALEKPERAAEVLPGLKLVSPARSR
jgi:GntR family transcriptional regulator of vanillate catabolism